MSVVHRFANFFGLNPYPPIDKIDVSTSYVNGFKSPTTLKIDDLLNEMFKLLDIKTLSIIRLTNKSYLNEANKQVGLLTLGKRLNERSYYYLIKDGKLETRLLLDSKSTKNGALLDSKLKIAQNISVFIKKLNLLGRGNGLEDKVAKLIESCPNVEYLALKSTVVNHDVTENILKLKKIDTLKLMLNHNPLDFKKSEILMNNIALLLSKEIISLKVCCTNKYDFAHVIFNLPINNIEVLPQSLKNFKTDQKINSETISKLNYLVFLDAPLSKDNILSVLSLSNKNLAKLTLRNNSILQDDLLTSLFSYSFSSLHTLTLVGFNISENCVSSIPKNVQHLRFIDCWIKNYRIFSNLHENVLKLYIYEKYSPFLTLSTSRNKEICKELVLPKTVKYLTVLNKDSLSSVIGDGLIEIEVDRPVSEITTKYLHGKSYVVAHNTR